MQQPRSEIITLNDVAIAEARSRALIENLPSAALFVVDRDLRYLLAQGKSLSAAFRQPKDLVGKTIFEVMPPEIAATCEPLYRQALAGESFEQEHQVLDRWFISRGTPLRSTEGEVYAVLVVSYDISDRKRAEAALRESEAKYSSIFNSIDEGFCISELLYDDAGKPFDLLVLETNPSFERMMQTTNAVGKRALEIFPDAEASWFEAYGRVVETGDSLRFENYLAPLYRWFELYISRIGGAGSRQFAIVFNDISDRKRAEALRESEEWHRTLFDSIDEGVCLFERLPLRPDGRRDYRYLAMNTAMQAMFGIPDLSGQSIRDNFPDEVEDWYDDYDRVLESGQPIRFQRESIPQGLVLEMFVTRLGDGSGQRLLAVMQDVTDRKQAEETVRQSEQRQSFLLKLSDALRSLADPVDIQETVTRTAMNYFGADRCYYCEIEDGNAIIRRDATRGDLPSVAGVYPLSRFAILQAVVDAGHPFIVQDVHTTDTVDEDIRHLCIQLLVISYVNVPVIKNGKPVGVLCLVQSTPRDWTDLEVELAVETAERTWAAVERARAEAALRESEIQRLREQSAREQERQRVEALAELDRAKTLFFSNISHEFRTPLTLSLAPLQDALSDRAHPLAPPQRERVELAHRNSLRLLKLVNTLLDFSRIEAGRMEAVYEPTDLATFTIELASVFRSAIERAGLRLIVDCPPLPESVYVDREMWEKIVLNLLSNAFKFTQEGEIAVRLHSADGDRAVLQIQDTGAGIEPEELPHIFERFYQVRTAKARIHESSGIGLALVRELIQLHGGTIDVSSTLGVGSCFTVTIPFGTKHLPSERLRRGEVEPIHAPRTLTSTALGTAPYVDEAERWRPQEAEEQRSGGAGDSGSRGLQEMGTPGDGENIDLHSPLPLCTSAPLPLCPSAPLHTCTPASSASSACILLVDDNADMRDYLTRILSAHHQVIAVADGAKALAAATERVPDLVLTDVMMPGLDGFGLLKALRADPHTREIPIILLSARAGEESVIEGLEAGADDYLIKPFSAQELVSRVNTHLQMSQLRTVALHRERTINRRKDELLSTVSHELNTPLVAILGWTRLLRANPSDRSMLMKSLETIERNAILQAKLIQDLLDITRISAGKLRLSLAPVELESVIEMAIATVTQTAIAKGINLNWRQTTSHHNADPILVMGDRDRLQQVLCNLLTNGIKFTPESGNVTVELSTIAGENSADHCYAEIRVIDTGIGISAEFLPYIFDRFRQAEPSASTKGLGLGLAIAHHLVELHNGTIHAESAGIGQGATLIIRLPLLNKD